MKCSKCGQENEDTIAFCVRCHHPMRFVCPACQYTQSHGGQCDKCGVDFAKYMTAMAFQAESRAKQSRETARQRYWVIKQVMLAVLTFGLSLLFFRRSRAQDD